MEITLQTPLTREMLKELRAGDSVKLNGVIYAARDAAHKRMINWIAAGRSLPFEVQNQIIYYVGPCLAKPGEVIGSAGPTTSSRMDIYAPKLIELGLTGMVGKGIRSKGVVSAMMKYGAVYFGAIGGAGAMIAKTIISEEIVAFPEFGTEAIRRLTVKDFPVTVIIDSYGNDLYETGKLKYRIL